jgi:hypothetical protein
MADAGGSHLNLGSPVAPRGRGHPRGSKNKSSTTSATAGSSSAALAKHRPGRPPGSKNKPKATDAAPIPIAPIPTAPGAPAGIFSFFYIAVAQCREIQCLPLSFTNFMDGRELREAVLREQSGGGVPYEVEVWYDGNGKQYFRGSWSRFVEDHDIHQGFFMAFDFHVSTSKFDVKIYDGTQCQKKYEAED